MNVSSGLRERICQANRCEPQGLIRLLGCLCVCSLPPFYNVSERLHEIPDCYEGNAALLIVYKLLVLIDNVWPVHKTCTIHMTNTALPIGQGTDAKPSLHIDQV